MNRSFRHVALSLAAAPLVLGLAACDKKAEETAAAPGASGTAPIAPPVGKAWADMVEKTPEGGYRVGNPNAPVKLIEFGALSCSHCAEFAETGSAELRNRFIASGRVSYELRLFMLNALDMPAVLLVTCGADDKVPVLADQFWAWQPNMFQGIQAAGEARLKAIDAMAPAQRFGAVAEASGMTGFITSRGVTADQAKTCLADTAKATALAKQTEDWSKQFGITGTPTFFINGEKSGSGTWPEVKAQLEMAGA